MYRKGCLCDTTVGQGRVALGIVVYHMRGLGQERPAPQRP